MISRVSNIKPRTVLPGPRPDQDEKKTDGWSLNPSTPSPLTPRDPFLDTPTHIPYIGSVVSGLDRCVVVVAPSWLMCCHFVCPIPDAGPKVVREMSTPVPNSAAAFVSHESADGQGVMTAENLEIRCGSLTLGTGDDKRIRCECGDSHASGGVSLRPLRQKRRRRRRRRRRRAEESLTVRS